VLAGGLAKIVDWLAQIDGGPAEIFDWITEIDNWPAKIDGRNRNERLAKINDKLEEISGGWARVGGGCMG
jgi:hypothetical protein